MVSLSSQSSNGLLIFHIGKIMRCGPALDAYEHGGYTFYTPLSGRELLEAKFAKIIEETIETINEHRENEFASTPENREKWLFELADLSEALKLLGVSPKYEQAGNLAMVLGQWQGHYRNLMERRLNSTEVLNSITYTRNSIDKYIRSHGLTQDDLKTAIRAKRKQKGAFMPNGRVDFIALPMTDEWIPYYRSKYKLVGAMHLGPAPEPHPDFYAVTQPG